MNVYFVMFFTGSIECWQTIGYWQAIWWLEANILYDWSVVPNFCNRNYLDSSELSWAFGIGLLFCGVKTYVWICCLVTNRRHCCLSYEYSSDLWAFIWMCCLLKLFDDSMSTWTILYMFISMPHLPVIDNN